MDSKEFASAIRGGSLAFDLINQEETVKKLREIADRIEKGEAPKLLLQSAHVCNSAVLGDFLMTYLVLEFAELHPMAPTGTKIYGGGSEFPAEVQK